MKIKELFEDLNSWGDTSPPKNNSRFARVRASKNVSPTGRWRVYINGVLKTIVVGNTSTLADLNVHKKLLVDPSSIVTLIPAKDTEYNVDDVDLTQHKL